MLIGRCKKCGNDDLQLHNNQLVCPTCGNELKFYQIEFIVVDPIVFGEPFRHDTPGSTLRNKSLSLEEV